MFMEQNIITGTTMVEFITDEQIRQADIIEAVDVDGSFLLQLWGQETVPHNSSPGSPARRIEVLRYPISNCESGRLAMQRIKTIRGRVPTENESLFQKLQASDFASHTPQFRISVLSDRYGGASPVAEIEFSGLSVEKENGSMKLDYRPYSVKFTVFRDIDVDALRQLVPSVEAQLRKNAVLGFCDDYHWTTN